MLVITILLMMVIRFANRSCCEATNDPHWQECQSACSSSRFFVEEPLWGKALQTITGRPLWPRDDWVPGNCPQTHSWCTT